MIFKESTKPGERKYSYLKDEPYSDTNRFSYARTLSLAQSWIDYRIADEPYIDICKACGTTYHTDDPGAVDHMKGKC